MYQTNAEDNLNEDKVEWFQNKILDWTKENLRVFPWRCTTDPYRIFVAEFLLQQTDAPRVVPVYEKVLLKYPNLISLAEAHLFDLALILKPLGFHYRASRLLLAARLIIEDPLSRGNIPDDENRLLQLPGVGKYIARSVCANAFHQPVAVLDTNVSRILQRFFGLEPHFARARDDRSFWNIAQKIAPATAVGLWNLALIDFGAIVCTSRNPHCSGCPLRQLCKYREQVSH
jgi:A/G-specific adenine glycosylase